MRSSGPSNLVPIVADIRAFERECARARREEEQQAHLQRLDTDMGDIPQNDAGVNGANNSEQLDLLALTTVPTFMVIDWESEHRLWQPTTLRSSQDSST